MANSEIKKIKHEYLEWGRKFGRRKRPIELRQAVLALSKRYGEPFVNRELGVSTASLWLWRRQAASEKSHKKRVVSKPKQNSKKMKFVELSPLVRAPVLSPVQISFERSDGSRMRAEGVPLAEIGRLANAFLSSDGGNL